MHVCMSTCILTHTHTKRLDECSEWLKLPIQCSYFWKDFVHQSGSYCTICAICTKVSPINGESGRLTRKHLASCRGEEEKMFLIFCQARISISVSSPLLSVICVSQVITWKWGTEMKEFFATDICANNRATDSSLFILDNTSNSLS